MRHLLIAFLTLVAVAGCGDDKKGRLNPDAGSNQPPDGPPVSGGDGIGDAKGTADGTGLSLKINGATITYIKPAIGNVTNDPAGFTIQAKKDGVGLFVSVDPATLNPVPAVGDVVSFTITTLGTVHAQKRAQAITDFTRNSSGADVSALATDITAATDVVSNVDNYDSRLVNVSGSAADVFSSAGQGFQKSTFTTTGITGDTNYQVRGVQTVIDSIDMVKDCGIAAHNVTVARFDAAAEIGVYAAGDVTLTNCPAPIIASATALTATSIKVTFSRNIKASSFNTDGSQFTFDNGLTVSAAVLAGRTVTLTTSAQDGATTYALTAAQTLTDLQGTSLTTNTANVAGFVTPAVVRINEFNANITGGCDLIELRVIADGSMSSFKLTERTGTVANGEMSFTFPTFNVKKNDLIVVHTNSNSTTCDPGGATAETAAPNDQPTATFGKNFDTAFDFYSSDTGLTATNNVWTLRDAAGNIVDAVFTTDVSTTTIAGGSLTAGGLVGAANQWTPAQATYDSPTFLSSAVPDLDATATNTTGNTIQRKDDNDTNAKDDWRNDQAATFGALNPGQVAL